MDINNLYVVVFSYRGSNETNDELVSDNVYLCKEDAEKSITDLKTMKVITLKDWGDEKYSSGYICAFG